MINQRTVFSLATIGLSLINFSCSGVNMQAHYSKSAVQPVTVTPLSNNQISIRYGEFPETVYYSKGVDYTVEDNIIKVFISRCHIHETCNPMAETKLPLGKSRISEVFIPYHNEKVVMVYSDLEEQIYP